MSGTNATVEVNGPGANSMARNLLNAAGIEAGQIEGGDIEISINGENGPTTLTLGVGGPASGELLTDMIGNVNWEDYNVESVSAGVEHGVSGSGGSDDPQDSESGNGGASAAFQPHVEAYVSSVDPTNVEFPHNQPGRIRAGTWQHLVAELILEARDVLDQNWIDGKTLGDYGGDDLDQRQAQTNLSRLFTDKGLLIRRKDIGSGTRAYEYHPTKQLAEEISRLGDYENSVESEQASA